MRNTILISLLLILLPVSVSAQFYTITRDSELLPTERQKEIIYLYFWEQMNQQDIAKCLGISQQTVWGTIKRSIEIMKKHLSESEN